MNTQVWTWCLVLLLCLTGLVLIYSPFLENPGAVSEEERLIRTGLGTALLLAGFWRLGRKI